MTATTPEVSCDLLSHWWTRPTESEVATWPAPPNDIAALLNEYERLFVGPAKVPCPPYESFWREDVPIDLRRSLVGPCTAELDHIYRQLGIQLGKSCGELADHIAVELEALAFASAKGLDDVADTIFSAHLQRWVPRLCRAVSRAAEHSFYKELAAETMAWLEACSEPQ